jgi:hypothetical protein
LSNKLLLSTDVHLRLTFHACWQLLVRIEFT